GTGWPCPSSKPPARPAGGSAGLPRRPPPRPALSPSRCPCIRGTHPSCRSDRSACADDRETRGPPTCRRRLPLRALPGLACVHRLDLRGVVLGHDLALDVELQRQLAFRF